ncbi:F-box/LRR-repeat protein 2 [Chelonia mydas]|uniref:F-box/LRR-repeat protein 2 n=1 Tax=Chelonia mydas TaxID=8469 RepID=M7BR51_CHEMY|nr:F-box/LRR-repeat protein 2 [Chelonia mydas]
MVYYLTAASPGALSSMSLSHCELITDDGILHLSNSTCGHERLQVLELDNCLLITDVTLEHLENCHSLERIELYDCQQVTRAGIKRIRVCVVFLEVQLWERESFVQSGEPDPIGYTYSSLTEFSSYLPVLWTNDVD